MRKCSQWACPRQEASLKAPEGHECVAVRPDELRDRAPPVHHPRRRPHPGDRSGRDRGARHASFTVAPTGRTRGCTRLSSRHRWRRFKSSCWRFRAPGWDANYLQAWTRISFFNEAARCMAAYRRRVSALEKRQNDERNLAEREESVDRTRSWRSAKEYTRPSES
jgi:hypothetical protein